MEKDDKLPDIKAICNTCQKLKVRNPDGFFPNGRDRRFVDEHGKQWVGKSKCPDCNRNRMKSYQKLKRNKDVQ